MCDDGLLMILAQAIFNRDQYLRSAEISFNNVDRFLLLFSLCEKFQFKYHCKLRSKFIEVSLEVKSIDNFITLGSVYNKMNSRKIFFDWLTTRILKRK